MVVLSLLASLILQVEEDLHRRLSISNVEILVDGRLSGSAWIADGEGHVVTAAHVLWGRKGKVEARLSSGSRMKVKVVAFDLGHDLALVRLPRRDKPWPPLELAKRVPVPGSQVYVFGAPQFRHRMLLPGKVARTEPSFEYLSDLKCAVRVIHIGGVAPSGTSGGCWVDKEGRVFGNQSGSITVEGHSTGIAFAAPLKAIRRLVKDKTSPSTADAGLIVEELTEYSVSDLKGFPKDVRGVLGVICTKDGPARAAGLEPRFVIRKVNGKAVETRDSFYEAIRRGKPGAKIRLEVIRKGAKAAEKVEITLRRLED